MEGFEFKPAVWKGKTTTGASIETNKDVLSRVRRKIGAAKQRNGQGWDELFHLSDKDKSGTVNWAEMQHMVRNLLRVPAQCVCDYELKILFFEIDKDGGGSIDVAELFEYIQHGPVRPQDNQAREHQRIMRVKKNIQIAFHRLSANEADVRKLFKSVDMDSSNRLTKYEFEYFVRNDLKLGNWDVKTHDLNSFFHFLDANGDGIDDRELFDFIRKNDKDRSGVGAQSFADGGPRIAKVKKIKTYRQKLEDGMRKSTSLPSLTMSAPFINLGRDSRPTSRAACGMF